MVDLILCMVFAACPISVEPDASVETTHEVYETVEPNITKSVPANAWKYREIVADELKKQFGDIDLLSVEGSKFMQEASWRCDLDSKYAEGCAQFSPPTRRAMAATKCADLGRSNPRDPDWAYRCSVRLDKQNYTALAKLCTNKSWLVAMILRAYNEGPGLTMKAIKKAGSCNPELVNMVSIKAKWAEKETDHYWHRIMRRWQPEYINAGYGGELI